MLGNDVVDLTDAETQPGATHPRFDERVFAAEELAVIATSAVPERMRWALWAAKESAYKAVHNMGLRAVFSPMRFMVEFDDAAALGRGAIWGRVRHGAWTLPVCVEAIEGGLHAVAAAGRVRRSAVHAVWQRATVDCPSAAVRRLALSAIAPRVGLAAEELTIVRQGRTPRLLWRGRPAPVILSLSHHGHLVACACWFVPLTVSHRAVRR